MINDDDIPVLTDLIENRIDNTQPLLDLDVDQDMYIDDDDDPALDLDILAEKPLQNQPAVKSASIDPELEKTIKRILDEHTELAWQEIRIAIQLALDDKE